MMDITLKQKKMKALRWNENFSDMKHFCGNHCTITYETCCVDDYWLLTVDDSIKGTKVTVAIGDYVVEYSDGLFTVINDIDLQEWFGGYEVAEGNDKEEMSETTTELENVIPMIPIDTRVKIIGTKYCGDVSYLYMDKEGIVKNYFPQNEYGRYLVITDKGYQSTFDKDELEVI